MIKLGIAGIGVIANDYIGLISSGAVAGVRITALCSRNPLNMAHAIEKHGLQQVTAFTDYREMLESGLINAVLICTPHGEHPRMARQAIEHDLHILVEKPIGVDTREVKVLIAQMALKPNLVGGVMYNRRMASAYRNIKSLIQDGAIGDLVRVTWLITNLYRTDAYYVSSPWRGTWQGEGGGLLMTQASHQIDLLQWLCGLPSSVEAQFRTIQRSIEVENEAVLLLNFPAGAWGQFIASAREVPGTNRLEICGSGGKITITDDSTMEICSLVTDERQFAHQSPDPFSKPDTHSQILCFDDSDNKVQQAATIQNFIDAIAGESEIQCSIEDALNSLSIIQSAYLSGWKRKAMAVPCPPGQFNLEMDRRTNGQ